MFTHRHIAKNSVTLHCIITMILMGVLSHANAVDSQSTNTQTQLSSPPQATQPPAPSLPASTTPTISLPNITLPPTSPQSSGAVVSPPAIALPVTPTPIQAQPNDKVLPDISAKSPTPSASSPPAPTATQPSTGNSPKAITLDSLGEIVPLQKPASTPPAPVTPAPTAPPTQPTITPEQERMIKRTLERNPDVLWTPLSVNNTSLIFTKNESDSLKPFIELYDNAEKNLANQSSSNPNADEDLKDFVKEYIESASHTQDKGAAKDAPPPPLPNINLESIVYYSPTDWSIWLNGRRLTSSRNDSKNKVFVSKISENEVVLVWKPPYLQDIPDTWKRINPDGKTPPKNVSFNLSEGNLTITMHAHETFMTRYLAITEGLIIPLKKPAPVAPAQVTPAAPAAR